MLINFKLIQQISRPKHSAIIRFSSNVSYTQTLNLPQSNFPMKHSRRLELAIEQQNVTFESLFPVQDGNQHKKTFILHDGPPYANGDAHFGHAINRIFKDIIVKRKMLENFSVDFRPGWDCHGLPIELKAVPNIDNTIINPLEIRRRARELAFNAIDRQLHAFKQFYLSAQWSSVYRTIDLEYSIQELNAFFRMYKNGLIFRDRMPVYWSPSTRTALAEAELQYKQDHQSVAAFIRYPIVDKDYDALIWTTTPWTLLANKAIAFSERMNYCCIVIDDGDHRQQKPLLVSRENIAAIQEIFKDRPIRIVQDSIIDFHGHKYCDPINQELKSFIPSQMITSSKGTGLVHIAPDHGQEDFKLYRQCFPSEKLNPKSIVDNDGNLRINGETIPIIDDNKASRYVLERILPPKSIVFKHDYSHNYPYDWRSSKPVIIKPSDQWFLDIEQIRQQCLDALTTVKIYPELLRKEMINQLSSRPNWCLSRQRKYGVPIPVFFHQQKPILNDQIFHTLIRKFIHEGTLDVWWQQTPEELLSEYTDSPAIDLKNLEKSQDILDIWFDSGCSWLSVLGRNQVADVYLEGVDQLRGWFQSSLITSVALNNRAPYQSIIIHGFALDQNGHKMSKSLGNVIDPLDIIDGRIFDDAKKSGKKSKNSTDCGVDGLRLWIARYACTHNDVNVNVQDFQDDIMTILNRFRNTFRFMLGYLTKFSQKDQSLFMVDINDQLPLIDQYLLLSLWELNEKLQKSYDEYSFGDIIESLIHFFNYKFSTFYLSRVKDRLYCDSLRSADVRSILTLFYYVYNTIGYHMAPIIPHIIIECQQLLPFERQGLIDANTDVKYLFEENFNEINKDFQLIQSIILRMNEWASSRHQLIDYDCHLSINNCSTNCDSQKLFKIFQKFQSSTRSNHHYSNLIECLQVARVSYSIDDNFSDHIPDDPNVIRLDLQPETVNNDPDHDQQQQQNQSKIQIQLRKTTNKQCQRCRRFNIFIDDDHDHDNDISNNNNLCIRCNFIMLDNKW